MIHNLHVIKRQLHESILEHLGQFPAVALLGSRQVGKTTLAELICRQRPGCIYLDLESTGDRNKLVDPESYLARFEDKLVILDEVQRLPEIFQPLRGLIDRGRRKGLAHGRFLLLGSASGDLLRQSAYPGEAGQRFHVKLDTHSRASWTVGA